jgi:negative regulator of genetic competence, sporulation and motility
VKDFYRHNTSLKWIVLAVSILISAGTIYYTNILVEQLKQRERQQVELFARALEYTLHEDSNDNILFVTDEIIFKNNSIPTVFKTRGPKPAKKKQ